MNTSKPNKSHLLSLIFGIASIPLFPVLIPMIVGFIYGFKGIKQSKQQDGYGKKTSITGISLSFLSVLLFVAMLLTPTKQHNDTPAQTNSSSTLPEIVKQNKSSKTALEEEHLSISKMKEESERIAAELEQKKKEADTSIDEPYKEPAFPPCLMAKKYQAATGIYTKNDILHLKISEEEREELLNLHMQAEQRKQNDDPKASDRRLFEKNFLATLPQREQAFFVFKKRFLSIVPGEGTYRFPVLESLIKPTMHDPDSFEHVALTCKFKKGKKKTDIGQIILQEAFRGKNALGNKVINYSVVVYDYDKDTFLDEQSTTRMDSSFKGTLIEDVQIDQIKNPQ